MKQENLKLYELAGKFIDQYHYDLQDCFAIDDAYRYHLKLNDYNYKIYRHETLDRYNNIANLEEIEKLIEIFNILNSFIELNKQEITKEVAELMVSNKIEDQRKLVEVLKFYKFSYSIENFTPELRNELNDEDMNFFKSCKGVNKFGL